MTVRQKSNDLAPDMQGMLGKLILGVCLIAAAVLAVYVAFFLNTKISSDPGDWGTLGDYFGGVMNPVVSFATLVVAYAVWKQQREELKATKEALEDQAKTAEQQRQEQRFFDLLALYQSTVASITLIARMSQNSDIPVQYAGKEAIAHFFRTEVSSGGLLAAFLQYGFYQGGNSPHKSDDLSLLLQFNENVDEQSLSKDWNIDETSATFDHYFRVLFKLLDESENLLGQQHFRYVKLLRAQLSRYEVMLIGLNLWLENEGRKMIPLAEKYGLLKHLPPGKLRQQLELCLPPNVFGDRYAAKKATEGGQMETSPC